MMVFMYFKYLFIHKERMQGFPGVANGEELTCYCRRLKRHSFGSLVGKIPWRIEESGEEPMESNAFLLLSSPLWVILVALE